MMNFSQPPPQRYQAEAELKIREQERKRDFDTYAGGTSRLSRRATVLIQLSVILLIIIGVVLVYHLLH